MKAVKNVEWFSFIKSLFLYLVMFSVAKKRIFVISISDFLNLLRANHGSLWLSGRPDHVAERHFGPMINKIFTEHSTRKLAAKIQVAQWLASERPPPVPRASVSQRPPAYPRRPPVQTEA